MIRIMIKTFFLVINKNKFLKFILITEIHNCIRILYYFIFGLIIVFKEKGLYLNCKNIADLLEPTKASPRL